MHENFILVPKHVGNAIGRGQDCVCAPYKMNGDANLRVIKWNHDTPGQTDADYESLRLYLLRKYHLCQIFIPEFVPKTDIFIGFKKDGVRKKKKVFQIQERIPQIYIGQLPIKYVLSEPFISRFARLINSIIYAQNIIDTLNREYDLNGDDALDMRLDLGWISMLARERVSCEKYVTVNELRVLINDMYLCNQQVLSTPNLLISPFDNRIFCVDLGKGVWNNKKERVFSGLLNALSC